MVGPDLATFEQRDPAAGLCQEPGVPPRRLDCREQPFRLQDRDLVGAGVHDAFLAQLAQDTDDDLTDRAGGLGELLPGDRRDELWLSCRSDARSSRCRARRCRTEANALPESSPRKERTRALVSASSASATRTSWPASRRTTAGRNVSRPASVSAWIANGRVPSAKSVAAPTRAPARQ